MALTARHERASELRARALRRLPGGVGSNVRLASPTAFFSRGQGARLWDVDGNEYIDYLLGQGPNFLGHAPPSVMAAVADACRNGIVYGAQHPLEVEAAERLCEVLRWPDLVRFGLSGTEMVQAALRLARAATGRRKFVVFEGHYHGWLDNVLVNVDGREPGPASAGQGSGDLADTIVLPWNDPQPLAEILAVRADEIAAVLMEPMMCNAGAILPRQGFLPQVRRLCDAHGIVLIFDEVITGFRLAAGGAAERFGVVPDLATYGKAMAGGWPVSALAGRGELMERLGTGTVNHSGTFNGSVMAAAATIATLDLLTTRPPYDAIAKHGRALMATLLQLGRDRDLPLRVQGTPAAFHVSFGPPEPVHDYRGFARLDRERYARLATALHAHGVWVATRGIWYVSAAHGDDELTQTLERVAETLDEAEPSWA
jgi:glutamate-1-semialdehyde 2,1-aminomutase